MNKKELEKRELAQIKAEIDKAIEDRQHREKYALYFVNRIFQNKNWFIRTTELIEKAWSNRFCFHCEKIKEKRNFYKVKGNSIYKNGQIPICKRCTNKLYHKYKVKYGSAYAAMEKICQLFDLYFDDRLFKNCDWDSPNAVGIYISKLNLRQTKFKKDYDSTAKSYLKKRGCVFEN